MPIIKELLKVGKLRLRIRIRVAFIFIISFSILILLAYLSYHQRFFFIILFLYLLLLFSLIYLFLPQIRMSGETKIGRKGKVYLTFDDGPSERWTPKILEILREKKVKACFFIVGQKAKRHPEVVRRILEQGHGIGNHTYTHRKLAFLSYRNVLKEIERCEDEIFKITGKNVKLLRTPHGFRSFFLPFIAKRKGLKVITWTKGIWDTEGPPEGEIIRRIFKRIKDGEILLLHDGNEKSAPKLLSTLPKIIDEYVKRGFEFGNLEEI